MARPPAAGRERAVEQRVEPLQRGEHLRPKRRRRFHQRAARALVQRQQIRFEHRGQLVLAHLACEHHREHVALPREHRGQDRPRWRELIGPQRPPQQVARVQLDIAQHPPQRPRVRRAQ